MSYNFVPSRLYSFALSSTVGACFSWGHMHQLRSHLKVLIHVLFKIYKIKLHYFDLDLFLIIFRVYYVHSTYSKTKYRSYVSSKNYQLWFFRLIQFVSSKIYQFCFFSTHTICMMTYVVQF